MKGLLALVLFVVIGFITYPGADVVSLTVWLSHPPSDTNPAVQGSLAWLHVEHPPGKTPFIADDQKRMVLLHGAIPGGLIDFWSGSDHAKTGAPPFYPIDPAAYDGRCPQNFATVKVPPLCQQDIDEMAAMGFNSIRLALTWSLLEPRRGDFDPLYLDRIAQVVGWAACT